MEGREFRVLVYNAAQRGNLKRITLFMNSRRDSKKWIDGVLNDNFSNQYPLVIAAREGHIDVVRYFLEVGADPSVSGVVEFDNDDIQGTPPLWAAAAAGHFEIVKILVEEAKADVNQTTQTHSTPLRGACYDGHLEIVKYLLDNGADINLPNRHGHTSLMIAAYRNKIDVVKYLLEMNADFNMQTAKGNSALHDAAESGNVEIVRILLDAKATLKKDFQGVCPLLCAAQSGHSEVVNILVEHAENNLARRDAYKLLGCTLVDKKMDSQCAVSCWKKAIDIELSEEEQQVVNEWVAVTDPMEVYDNAKEIHLAEDLTDIIDNMDAIRMQSLLMRERILGGSHTDVHYYLRFRGAVYCDLGQMDRCYVLWKHALELQQKHFSPLHPGTVTTLQSFQETFGMTLNDYVNAVGHADRELRVSSSLVSYVFDKVCHEFERVISWGDRPMMENECCGEEPCKHTNVANEKKKLCVTALLLINVLERLSLPTANRNEIDDKLVDLDVARLVSVCEQLKLPILHYSLEEMLGDDVDYMSLPRASVLKRLLQEDVDPAASNAEGDSPIHIILQSTTVRRSLIRILLDHGALLFAKNSKDDVVYDKIVDILKTEGVNDIPLGKYMTLSGLSANALCRHRTFEQLQNEVPRDILPFLRKHCAKREKTTKDSV